jgi:hypothetical protein
LASIFKADLKKLTPDRKKYFKKLKLHHFSASSYGLKTPGEPFAILKMVIKINKNVYTS